VGTTPVLVSVMLCIAEGEVLRALSVKTAALEMGPATVGTKSMLRLQLAPAASEKLLVQSAGVPEPATFVKFVPTVRPGATAFNDWLPMFCAVTDFGLSVLVLPSTVGAKLNVGGCERFTSSTRLLLKSAMKTSPTPSTAIPRGLSSPLPTVIWQAELAQPAGSSST
jgi:hypothetical protein